MGRLRLWPRALLVPSSCAFGALVGWLADGDLWATTVLFAEPALWILGVWAVYFALSRRDMAGALGVACAGVGAAVCARLPPAPAEEAGIDPAPFVSRVQVCARNLPLPTHAVRLLTWTIGESWTGVASAVADTHPDVVVLFGRAPPDELAAVAAAVGGEITAMDGQDSPVTVVARGTPSLCGEADRWSDRPAAGADEGLVFVNLGDGVTFPLMVARLPEPWSQRNWEVSMRSARQALAVTADALASSLLVAAVDAPVPAGAPRLGRALRDIQLLPVARPLNWPAAAPGLFAFDQVWAAGGWVAGPSKVVTAMGPSRAGVVVDLSPRWPVSLPAPGNDDPVR